MSANIDIILAVHNPGREFSLCLRSCLRQNYARRCRLIVVDDGSDVPIKAALEPYIFSSPIELHLIRSERRRGLSFARNMGIEQSDAALILFQDSCDLMPGGRLALTAQAFQEDPFLMMLYGNVHLICEEEIQPTLRYRTPPSLPHYASSVAIRRCILDAVGLFREDMDKGEESDLWKRIREHYPLGVKYLPEKMAYCRLRGLGSSMN